MGRWIVAACVVVLGPAAANAQEVTRTVPEQRAAPWSLSVEAGTSFPFDVGGRASVEVPGRISLSGSLGYMPRQYADALNDALVTFGAYDDRTAEIIEAGLRNTMVTRAQIGWRPFASSGFYVSGGYGLLALGGGFSSAQSLAIITGQPIPADDDAVGAADDLIIESTIHQAVGELGWTFAVMDRLQLRTSVGGFYTVDANTRISFRESPLATAVASPLLSLGERHLDDLYRTYLHAPFATATLGYVFF